ncbi:MAG: Glu/Leu/Phe/Val dehydrogenase dimerization domain-containing protein [Candidatus Palauibacterales bacterium]|nr:Glu/Leu/Phe/Val dehydrogenase dimerization domain-containing protein [Candidatus Palauibacterales bacterium]
MAGADARDAEVWQSYEEYFRAAPEIVFEWNDRETAARGWLVINSLKGGAAGGGTRMRSGLTRDEVTFLAKAMELKFAFAGPNIGGAKSGIDFDPSDPRKQAVLERWFRAIRPELLSRYGTAGDLNVSESEEVIPLCRDLGIAHPQIGVLKGHFGLEGESLGRRSELMHIGLDQPVPAEYGLIGKEARVFALVTGYSVARSASRLLEHQGRSPSDTRVLLQGFGSVGGAAALYMSRAGFRIVGIADARGCLLHPDGFSVREIEKLLLDRHGNTLPSVAGTGVTAHPAELFDAPADLMVAAAASGTLDMQVLTRLEAAGVRSLVAGANHPFAASAPGDTTVEQAADGRFAVVADIIASCGTAHAFACQSRTDLPLQPGVVFQSIEATVAEAVDEAVERAGAADRGLLAAALGMALERCEGSPSTQNRIGVGS